jgi:uncharacterized protein (TIGR03663 family)
VQRLAFAFSLGALMGLGLALRLPDLALKPLHYDEGVNGWFTLQLDWWNLYRYDPTNYHGPLLYYLNLVFFRLLGPGETALRMGTALAGALLPLALLPARRFAGDAALLVAALAIAVSPGLVYFSRTAIHEIHLVLATALWATALARFAASPRVPHALLGGVCAGLAFASKETAVITTACLGAGALLAWLAGRPGAGGAPDLFAGRTRRAALLAWTLGARRAWVAGALAFAAVVVLLFSSFGSHPRGVVDLFAAYGPWTEYGVSGRNQAKPAAYFVGVMASTVGAWRLLALPAALLALATRERLGLALAGWAGASLLVYSAIPYKTPWCVLEIDLPVLLLVAWAAGRAAQVAVDRARPAALRAGAGAALLACLAPAPLQLARTLEDNRERFDDFRRPYVYYQTFEEFHDMLRDLFGVRDAAGAADGLPLLSVDLEFPLSFYLLTRGWPLDRMRHVELAPGPESLAGVDVVVGSSRQQEEIEALLAAAGGSWHRERYYHRPGSYAYVWYRDPLWRRYGSAGGREASPWPRPPRRELPAPERVP